MPLTTGQSLLFYEILGPLGVGGMGEVYRARDTRLEREVAIKVLPAEFADDGERLQRFEREAKTLASLNHPNVAGIHGVDQVGDVCFLALELVPGEDLGERLARGPLPVDEAVEVARQIAEGLEAAHEAGVIHRDLKPANVRVTPEGVAKILDFGLAKPICPKATREGTTSAESDSFLMTEEGLVLGTPTYMSPEQARGKPVDRRTDLWAFGCVLYECLTGRRAFVGESMTDILAAIVGADPDWDLLPPLPPRVRELLERALAKNPRERLRDAGEARAQLELAQAEGSRRGSTSSATAAAALGLGTGTGASAAKRGRGALRPVPLLLCALALAAGYVLRLAGEPDAVEPGALGPAAARQMAVVLAETEEEVSDLELSPDGSRVAWTQPSGIFIRAFDSFDVIAVTLDETEAAHEEPYCLAWSPDGSQLAFTTPRGLWRIDADGKHLTLVTRDQLPPDSHAQLDWSRDGQLVYSDGASRDLLGRSFLVDQTTPLFSGDAKTTLHFDGVHILPDASLLGVRHRLGIGAPDTLSLWREGALRDVLQLPGWNISGPAYASGSLIFERHDTIPNSIWCVTMDLEAGEIVGDPRRVVDNALHATLVDDTLAYVVPDALTGMRPAWVDLEGMLALFPAVPAAEMQIPTLAHDGQRAFVFDVVAGGTVWAHDGVTGERSRAGMLEQGTVAAGDLADGRLLTFRVMGGFPTETVAVSPSGASEVVCEGFIVAVSRDARLGIAMRIDGEEGTAVAEAVDLADGGEPIELGARLGAPSGMNPGGMLGDLSPDKRWALLPSYANGRLTVVLVSTRGDSTELPVLSDGVTAAYFSQAGDEIYYWRVPAGTASPFINAVELWRVGWQPDPEPTLGTHERLFVLDEPVLVTGFDAERGRFLAAWRQTAGRHRILARTGWTDPQLREQRVEHVRGR